MWKRWRRKKLLSVPFPTAWRTILVARLPVYVRLPEPDQRELEGLTQIFLTEKNFEGCGGLVLNEEIKVCIAAQACLLLLHRNADCYPGLHSVLVYPSSYLVKATYQLEAGVTMECLVSRSGEAWARGSVVLALDAIQAGASNPRYAGNLVIHEFAHLLDYEDGWSNGVPLLSGHGSRAKKKGGYLSWSRVLTHEYEQLRAKAQRGDEVYLDVYGATNPAEFFAVASETFFEWPHEMKLNSPELYEELKRFYLQDPARWSPILRKPDNAVACINRGMAKEANGNLDGSLAEYSKAIALDSTAISAYVSRGKIKRSKGDLAGALADFDKAVELDHCHAQAYYHRGTVRQASHDSNGAEDDYNEAIKLKPEYLRAFQARGRLRYDMHRFTDALVDFRKACELGRSLYDWCRIWLIRTRLGAGDSATQELQKYLETCCAENDGAWQVNIARFLVGEVAEADLFKTVEDADNNKESYQYCEACFYAGAKRLVDGNLSVATELFKKCLATGRKNSAPCQSAAAELRLLLK